MIALLLGIFTFVQLNCENLFDTIRNTAKNDVEYTPDGKRKWSRNRYYSKLNNIGKAIISCGENVAENREGDAPDMIALCEIENDSVLYDLAHRSVLRSYHYEGVMTDSPDARGVNTALLYNPNAFRLIESRAIRVSLPDKHPTRDILYVKGLLVNLDTLHVFVLHSPSRHGGERISRPSRLAVSRQLVLAIDSIRSSLSVSSQVDGTGRKPLILVSGDFNDYSGDPALRMLEEHGLTELSKDAPALYNKSVCKGTYFYQGEWNSLDHIFASEDMAQTIVCCNINDHPSLLEPDSSGNLIPKRGYLGYRYNNGFSDHLPLVARFKVSFR
ncbi:MAG: endonuclease [Bacteroidaceae bacterium]|nr:endonuclease [Bacteroidaceae bacterium]